MRIDPYRWSCVALIALGVLHLVVMGAGAVLYVPEWLGGILWTFDHWSGVADQARPLFNSGFAFWSSIGSAGPLLIIIGGTLLSTARHGLAPPLAIVVAIILWALIGTALMPTSGFPLILLASLGLLFGPRARHHAA